MSGPNDVSYLDDVYWGGNRLSGYLDGRNNFVEYQGKIRKDDIKNISTRHE